jgi:hypothetical protein
MKESQDLIKDRVAEVLSVIGYSTTQLHSLLITKDPAKSKTAKSSLEVAKGFLKSSADKLEQISLDTD